MADEASGGSHEIWTSKFAFLVSAAAAAIGLGSLWRFPYVAGVHGGGAFVILYIFFVVVLCLPIMIGEMAIGRRGSGSAITSVSAMVWHEKASTYWRAIGWLSLLIPFFGLSYYSVVAGWALDYARLAVVDGFSGTDPAESTAIFEGLISSPGQQALLQFLFIAASAFAVARGVRSGIETVSKYSMAALFAILIGLVIYNAVALGLGPSIRFLMVPDFSELTVESVLIALGQALFSVAIGVGVLITYAAYLPKGVNLPQAAGLISIAVVSVALMAGFAIFPTVFFYGLQPEEGPNLIFVTLPVAFGQMTGGQLIAIPFFILVVLGAFTTAVGMLEPVVAWLLERLPFGRATITYITALAVFAVGLPSLLSFNIMSDIKPVAGMTFFDLLDFGIANLLLPLNALLIALFVGWVVRRDTSERETDLRGWFYSAWRAAVRFVAPVCIIGLVISFLS